MKLIKKGGFMNNIFLCMGLGLVLLCGCSEKQQGLRICNDIVPCQVIVNDFVEVDRDGTHALYKICGRVEIIVPMDKAELKEGKKSVTYNLPSPRIDSITFDKDKTKIIKQDRFIFTSLKKDEQNHFKLRQEAVKAIKKAAEKNEDVIKIAKGQKEAILE
jgi:hypothetical protein